LYGQIVDHWQITIADAGPAGIDKGKGGKLRKRQMNPVFRSSSRVAILLAEEEVARWEGRGERG
jgi:hypothetical protein